MGVHPLTPSCSTDPVPGPGLVVSPQCRYPVAPEMPTGGLDIPMGPEDVTSTRGGSAPSGTQVGLQGTKGGQRWTRRLGHAGPAPAGAASPRSHGQDKCTSLPTQHRPPAARSILLSLHTQRVLISPQNLSPDSSCGISLLRVSLNLLCCLPCPSIPTVSIRAASTAPVDTRLSGGFLFLST